MGKGGCRRQPVPSGKKGRTLRKKGSPHEKPAWGVPGLPQGEKFSQRRERLTGKKQAMARNLGNMGVRFSGESSGIGHARKVIARDARKSTKNVPSGFAIRSGSAAQKRTADDDPKKKGKTSPRAIARSAQKILDIRKKKKRLGRGGKMCLPPSEEKKGEKKPRCRVSVGGTKKKPSMFPAQRSLRTIATEGKRKRKPSRGKKEGDAGLAFGSNLRGKEGLLARGRGGPRIAVTPKRGAFARLASQERKKKKNPPGGTGVF